MQKRHIWPVLPNTLNYTGNWMTSAVFPTNNTVWIWDSRYMVNIFFCFEVFAQDKNLHSKKKKIQNAKQEKTQAHIFKRASFRFCASYLRKRCGAHRFPGLFRHSFQGYKVLTRFPNLDHVKSNINYKPAVAKQQKPPDACSFKPRDQALRHLL